MNAIADVTSKNLTGDPGQEIFIDGITDVLTTELGKISALRVIS